jgi:hypothetical protein
MSQCPCGLTREELNKHNLVDKNGRCTAFDAENQPCGRRLVDHPHAPAGHSIHFFLCSLKFISSPISSVSQPQG